MKANGSGKWAVTVSVTAILGVQALGQATNAMATTVAQSAQVKRTIVVSLEDR